MSVTRFTRAAFPAIQSRMAVRYSSGSNVHNNDPVKIQTEKEKNMKNKQHDSAPHKEHAPGWNEKLASDSEAAVKADQAVPKGKPGKDLQDKTVDQTHEHHGQK